MPRSVAPAIPMTLGNMREQGVRSLSVSCRTALRRSWQAFPEPPRPTHVEKGLAQGHLRAFREIQ